MTVHVYAIKDNLNGFISLSLDENDASATRAFAFAVLNENSITGFAPDDFDLYHIGIFDMATGAITQDDMPQLVIRGSSIVRSYREFKKSGDEDD